MNKKLYYFCPSNIFSQKKSIAVGKMKKTNNIEVVNKEQKGVRTKSPIPPFLCV